MSRLLSFLASLSEEDARTLSSPDEVWRRREDDDPGRIRRQSEGWHRENSGNLSKLHPGNIGMRAEFLPLPKPRSLRNVKES